MLTALSMVPRLTVMLVFIVSMSSAWASTPPQAAIASASAAATEAGMAVLKQGGNAFDAAITVATVLAVTEPGQSGIGGGGFWLLQRAEDGQTVMLDGRETAPMLAKPDMYLDDNGEPRPQAALDGALAAGIPGTPAALAYMAEHYGELPLAKTLAPAIKLAQEGFAIDEHYQRTVAMRLAALQASPAAAAIFLDKDKVPPLGYKVVQADLAQVLQQMASQGRDGFYQGKVAAALVNGVRQAGGIWTAADLQHYQIKVREPLRAEVNGMTIITAPPPSAGGIALIEMLNILQTLPDASPDSDQGAHYIVESMRRAYWDRARYLGDPDYVNIPVTQLISTDYAQRWGASIASDKATPSAQLRDPLLPPSQEGENTTHFSIIDQQGNRVAATLSLNYAFGSGFVPPGTGVLLNNEMDDFAMGVGVANVYGLVGSQPNLIKPGKRPLSSMMPTFLETKDRVAILGSTGGSRIPTAVLLAALDFAAGHGPQSWVSLGRYHHQYLPDEIQYEIDGLSPARQQALKAKGHQLTAIDRKYGSMQAVLWDKKANQVQAVTDPRQNGKAEVKALAKSKTVPSAATPTRGNDDFFSTIILQDQETLTDPWRRQLP